MQRSVPLAQFYPLDLERAASHSASERRPTVPPLAPRDSNRAHRHAKWSLADPPQRAPIAQELHDVEEGMLDLDPQRIGVTLDEPLRCEHCILLPPWRGAP